MGERKSERAREAEADGKEMQKLKKKNLTCDDVVGACDDARLLVLDIVVKYRALLP